MEGPPCSVGLPSCVDLAEGRHQQGLSQVEAHRDLAGLLIKITAQGEIQPAVTSAEMATASSVSSVISNRCDSLDDFRPGGGWQRSCGRQTWNGSWPETDSALTEILYGSSSWTCRLVTWSCFAFGDYAIVQNFQTETASRDT